MAAHNNHHNQRTRTSDLMAKPRRLQPAKRNVSQKQGNPGDVKTPSGNRRRRSNANSHSSVGLAKKETPASTAKKGPGGTRKAAVGTSKSDRSATGVRGRKRGRTK